MYKREKAIGWTHPIVFSLSMFYKYFSSQDTADFTILMLIW